MIRILGIDIGTKRIGLAISDPLGITAQGLDTLMVEDKEPIKALKEIIKQHNVKEVVVGLPLNMNGSEGKQARESAAFAERLKNEINLPVKLWDERLSSAEVERTMLEADISRKKRKHARDKLSAQVILQSYLNVKR